MKLNAQTTALGLLSNNADNQILLPEESINMQLAVDFFKNEFKSMAPLFSQRIQYISRPFYNALEKNKEKILAMLKHEPIKRSGTFIMYFPNDLTLTIFYDLETKCTEKEYTENGRIIYFSKQKIHPYPYLLSYTHIDENYATTFRRTKEKDQDQTGRVNLNTVLGLILFIKYCEVETKLIPPGKETTHRLQRYVNHTKVPIEILDATWFTTLVRSGAFTVGNDTGGFFRWQAVGTERSERKLIWVSPYQKQGYTRKAKVLAHRPETPN